MSTPTRRSGRERKSNPRYATVEWDKETIRNLRASSESSGSSLHEDLAASQGEKDDLELELAGESDSSAAVGDDAFSVRSALSQGSEVAISNDDRDNNDDETEADAGNRVPSSQTRLAPRVPITNGSPSAAHSRGVTRDVLKSTPKDAIYYETYGPCVDDLVDVLRARDTWLKGRDITIPSRQTLSEAEQIPFEDVALPTSNENVPRRDDPVYNSLSEQQLLEDIEQHHLQTRYVADGQNPHLVFMGPYGKEQKYHVAQGASLDYGQAWKTEGVANGQNGHSYHQGWILNLGEKVQSVSWAPSNKPHQYLAVGCRCTSAQRDSRTEQRSGAPAFSASSPYPSNIQIWKFATEETTFPGVRTLAMVHQPVLAMVIATDWGNTHQVRWRPAEGVTNVDGAGGTGEGSFRGVLGVLSSDGRARVITVSIPEGLKDRPPLIVRVQRAGCEIAPPQGTSFTAFAFATPSDIILGCTDGSIHLFDLTESTAKNKFPVSYMSHSLHNTYVIAVTPATPSRFSHFVSSVSASGDLVLVDLRSPEQDHISIHRACFPNRDLVYSPLSRSFITALDRAGNTHIDSSSSTYIMCHHMRQFHASHRVAKLPDYGGTATALAASPWHPCILASNARGTVMATNFLRKVLPQTRKDLPRSKATTGAYIQKICEYEWRPLTKDELRDEAGTELSSGAETMRVIGPPGNMYHGHDVRPGASKFTEGFKPDRIHVGHPVVSKKESPQLQELGAAEATFEEEQAVTVMEWNVNRHCAGLVAIGWGSGLLRVQDLAHDLES